MQRDDTEEEDELTDEQKMAYYAHLAAEIRASLELLENEN